MDGENFRVGWGDSGQRALAMRDRAWAELRKHRDAIDRIAKEGPTRAEDIEVMAKVFNVVSAELIMRANGDVE